jgi:hypothetical protein
MNARAAKPKLAPKSLWGLLLLAGAMLVLAGTAVLPYLWYDQVSDTVAERQLELRLIESRLTRNGQQKAPPLTSADDLNQLFLPGSTSGLTLADFQRLLNQTAEKNGMVIERIQPLQSDPEQGLSVFRMEAVATGNIEALRAFTLALETMVPMIFITQAQISPDEARRLKDPEYPSESLSLALQVEAYGWKDPDTQ